MFRFCFLNLVHEEGTRRGGGGGGGVVLKQSPCSVLIFSGVGVRHNRRLVPLS